MGVQNRPLVCEERRGSLMPKWRDKPLLLFCSFLHAWSFADPSQPGLVPPDTWHYARSIEDLQSRTTQRSEIPFRRPSFETKALWHREGIV